MANTNLETMTVGSDVFATFHNCACSTAAATAAKTATAENTFALFTGANVRVTFANANTAANPTLNINSTGAKPIMVDTATAAGDGTWSAGAVLDLRYNGTSWLIVSGGAHDAEKANQAQITGVFSASASYAVGEYVVYGGSLYRCTTAHSGAWNAAHFTQVTVCEEINTRTPVYGNGVNLLDNWYFIGGGSQQGGEQLPINQRGQTIQTGSGYFIDRWRKTTGTQATIALDGDGLYADNGAPFIRQYSEMKQYLIGKICTYSVLLKYAGLQTITHEMTADGRFTQFSDTKKLNYVKSGLSPADNTTELVGLYGFSDDRIIAVKLELGDTQTLAHQDANENWVLNDPPPNFQQELAKCQRYFQVFRDQNLRPVYGMDYRPPMAKSQPTPSSFVLDGVTYYTASAES